MRISSKIGGYIREDGMVPNLVSKIGAFENQNCGIILKMTFLKGTEYR